VFPGHPAGFVDALVGDEVCDRGVHSSALLSFRFAW
jgi:hypothetical protein